MRTPVKSEATFRPSDSYLRCVKRFALRPLKGEDEYRAAVEKLGRLAAREGLDEGEMDYLQALSQFVGDFEQKKHHINTSGLSPLEILRHLMEENNMTTTDLGHVLGSRGLASEVLNAKRGLSKTLIRRLAERFAVNPGIFLAAE